MKRIIGVFLASVLVCGSAFAADVANYRVIPLPSNIEMGRGSAFVLDGTTTIFYAGNEEMRRNAEFLSEYISEATGLVLPVTTRKSKSRQIRLSMVSRSDKRRAGSGDEGYTLTVSERSVAIEGATAAGVFHGIQTLRKSLPLKQGLNDVLRQVELPAVSIHDEPRFAYRGMHLDCVRHFFPLDFVKKFIDMLALHNMNTFHWHLTDDQGWRLEIKKYPRLTEVGSKRSGTIIGNNSDVDDCIPHGGYYTQAEAREIVEYARARHITVIPEIEMPGHAKAALASYPELGCTGGPYEVGHQWGVYYDVLCVGNKDTFEFVKGVLDEVIEIFPSETIHIGGDETPTVRWDECPKCRALKLDGSTLQGYFTRQVEAYLKAKGRRAIGWDEILTMGADGNTTIMSWRGTEPGIAAAEAGHDVIMAPMEYCYFDYCQTNDKAHEPSNAGWCTIDVPKVYGLDPVPDSVSALARRHIIGVQANLWSEHIPTTKAMEYMALPRMAALAEVAWTLPERKDYQDFLNRITLLSAFYDLYGWTYAKHIWPERMTKDRWHV